MSRFQSADPRLTELAGFLRILKFEDMTHEDWDAFALRQKANELINVSMYPDGKTYRVRLYLGSRQRCIGITENGPHAAMFADMGRLFFWPYRLRDTRPPRDADFNYGIERAQSELLNNDRATETLEKIRDHLLQYNELKVTNSEEAAMRGDHKRAREHRRTAAHELREFLNNATAGELSLSTRLDEIKSIAILLDQRLQRIEERLTPNPNWVTCRAESLERLDYTPTVDSTPAIDDAEDNDK